MTPFTFPKFGRFQAQTARSAEAEIPGAGDTAVRVQPRLSESAFGGSRKLAQTGALVLGRGPADRLPLDLGKPFDAHAEAAMLDAAVRGEKNHWSAALRALPRQYRNPEALKIFSEEIKRAAHELSATDGDELYVRAYQSIAETRHGMGPSVMRYLQNLKEPLERGPVLHGYVDQIATPEEGQPGQFKDLVPFLDVLQGRADPRNPVTKLLRKLGDRLFHRTDGGMLFNRLMVTPIHEEDGLDGGYSQIDPMKVDARLGGNEQRHQFAQASMRRGIELISDRVPNHNSYLHERTQALMAGDLSRLPEHINLNGAVKVDAHQLDGQKWNVVVHPSGAVSRMWAIFPDSNPDNIVRLNIPLEGKYQDLAELQKHVGHSFAMDDEARAAVSQVYARHGFPEPNAEGKRYLSPQAVSELEQIRDANNARVRAHITDDLAHGRTPYLDVDVRASFMGGIQYDKNLSHPAVLQEELAAHGQAAEEGQTGNREDAVIHSGDAEGTDHLSEQVAQSYMRMMNLVTELMMPGRVLIPEANLPKPTIEADYLNPSITVNGKRHATMGNLAISFDSGPAVLRALLNGEAVHYLRQTKSSARPADAHGDYLEYAPRLHDEALMSTEHFQQMVDENRIHNPSEALTVYQAALKAQGKTLSVEDALGFMRAQLEENEGKAFVNFANRGVGDDPYELFGKDPDATAMSLAMVYSGAGIPAVSFRTLVGAGNNVDFALQQMKLRLDKQAEMGEPLNFAKAFDARDLGRGPVPLSLWKARIKEGFAPINYARGLNRLWHTNRTFRTRQPIVIENDNPAVGAIGRRAPDALSQPLLQLFNTSKETQTVRLSKAALAEQLGWTDPSASSFRNVFAEAMRQKVPNVRLADDGDFVSLELPPQQAVFLERNLSKREQAQLSTAKLAAQARARTLVAAQKTKGAVNVVRTEAQDRRQAVRELWQRAPKSDS